MNILAVVTILGGLAVLISPLVLFKYVLNPNLSTYQKALLWIVNTAIGSAYVVRGLTWLFEYTVFDLAVVMNALIVLVSIVFIGIILEMVAVYMRKD